MSAGPQENLILRCCRGDSTAWDELFDLHYGPTHRFIFQLSPELSKEDTDEICQETFVSVIKSLSTFQGNSQLQTWIFRIASNKARDYMEKSRTAKRGGGSVTISLQMENPETGLTVDPPSPAASPDDLLLKAENSELIAHALYRLEEPCREVIELRYFGDLSYEEISRELKLNEKTVSSRLSKCLDRLEKIAREIFCGEKKDTFPV